MLTITTDVFCDDCPQWVHGATGYKVFALNARKMAKNEGWKSIREGGELKDICPNCWKKRKEKSDD